MKNNASDSIKPISIKRRSLKKDILKNWDLYLILIIPMAILLIFNYYPMLGLQIAFKKFNATGGIWGSPWVGWANFEKLFATPKIWDLIKNTLSISIYGILVEPIVTMFFALFLNAVYSKYYKKTVQFITYMPHFISTVVMVGILTQLLNPSVGIYGKICEFLGVEAVDLMGKPAAFNHLYIWSNIWQNIGWNTIIYIAALASVDLDLYEAAALDGANRFKQMIHIDLPVVLPTFVVLLILKVGSMMSVGYEKVLLMQNPLNLRTSEIISTYSYKVALVSSSDYSYGTAISLFNSVINLILITTVNKISQKVSETSLW